MKQSRNQYGVKIAGCSGHEILYCKTRSDANRVRRVIREYTSDDKNFSGAETLSRLSRLASKRRGITAEKIINEFEKKEVGHE